MARICALRLLRFFTSLLFVMSASVLSGAPFIISLECKVTRQPNWMSSDSSSCVQL